MLGARNLTIIFTNLWQEFACTHAFFCWLIPDGSSKRLSTSIKCPDDTRPFDVSLLNCTQAPLPPSLEWWICIRGIHALPKRLSLKNPFSHNWKHSVWSKRFVSLKVTKQTTTVNKYCKIKWYKSDSKKPFIPL